MIRCKQFLKRFWLLLAIPLILCGATLYTSVGVLRVTGGNDATPSVWRDPGVYVYWNAVHDTFPGATALVNVHNSGTFGGWNFYDIITGSTGTLGLPQWSVGPSGAGLFSQVGAYYGPAATFSAPGLFMAWNGTGTLAEGDFYNNTASRGAGGFRWYNTNVGASSASLLASLDSTGGLLLGNGLTATSGAFSGLVSANQVNGTLSVITTGDFQTLNVGGVSTLSGQVFGQNAAFGGAISAATLTSTGATTANSLSVTNGSSLNSLNVSGDSQMNTMTAGGTVALNGQLTGLTQAASTNSTCTTGSSANSTCTFNLNWSRGYSGTGYKAVCTGVGPNNTYGVPGLLIYSKATNGITVMLSNGQGSAALAATFSEVDCVATP